MLDDHENELFEMTRQDVADMISSMTEAGAHAALVFAEMMSIISEAITTEGFWDDVPPSFEDTRGFGNLMWKLREKAFADLAAVSSGRDLSSTVRPKLA